MGPLQFLRIGDIQPRPAGASGQVILAWRPDLLDDLLVQPLDELTANTITNHDDLRRAAATTRANGYAISVGERELGLSSLAAPIFNAQADLAGALAISGPTSRLPKQVCEQWVELLVESAETTTRMMGGRHPSEG